MVGNPPDSRTAYRFPGGWRVVAAGWLLAAAGVNAGTSFDLTAGSLHAEIEVATDRLTGQFGPRFDRTGFVRSVTVDGIELLGPWGLADEFGLFGDGVLGYEAAAIDETFLKIGVGRLRRDTDEDYKFDHSYPVETAFPVEVSADAGAVSVTQLSDGVGPWQYRYRKTYLLSGPGELTIRYELSNTGAVDWSFEHYNHHWFRLADVAVGPGYRVATGFDLPEAPTGLLRKPRSLAMAAPLPPGGAEYYASDLAGIPASANYFALEIEDRPVVRYQGSFPPRRLAVYADTDGFCPEVFMRSTLAPGETARWSATYRFRTN